MEEFGIYTQLEEPVLDEGKKRRKTKYIIFILLIIIIAIGICFYVIKKKLKKEDNPKGKGKKEENYDNWANSYKKADEFISYLNLTEQIYLLYGTENMAFYKSPRINKSEFYHLCEGRIDPLKNDYINFKGICLQDGPAGIRFSNGTSISYQSNLNLAATFNKTLMYEVGKAQGEEGKAKGINILLSPCVNIMRTPQSGRVWEAFGEDPFYSGVCASQMIKGIQDAGVIATLKHFVGNDQETYRHASSSNIEMAALMDIYVEPFYRAIHDGNVGSIMAAYNALNNTYCSESRFLLTDVLRGILDFKGFVMSDWWGIYSNHSDTFNSGLDMNMPGGSAKGPFFGRQKSFWSNLEQYVKDKIIPKERVTEAAKRIIATMYQFNQMENFPETNLYIETKTDERISLQRKAATESQILLKNDNNILPLKNFTNIAIIGNSAAKRDCGIDDNLYCQNATNKVQNGHIPLGYGSGTTKFNYSISPLEGIIELAEKKNITIKYSCNLNYTDEEGIHIRAKEDIENGIKIAKDAEVVIIFVKADSGEEDDIIVENSIGDRLDLDVWQGGNELIENISEVNDQIIVVINAPAVVNLPWLNKVKAVIFSGFPGAESGHAIADILFGEVSPSAHLPFVWGKIDDYGAKIEFLTNYTKDDNGKTYKEVYRYDGIDSAGKKDDLPGHDKEQYNYTDGLYVGQRWFNKHNKTPIFPFGHGLTYTSFEYSNLKINMSKEGLTAEFMVKNNGSFSASAVPMMFLTFPKNIGEYPEYLFKGFEKIELEPGEIETVIIKADEHALSYFNVDKNKYVRVNEGKIKVYIGENGDPNDYKLSMEIDSKY